LRELLAIGIGPGHPDQITVQAVQALNRADVIFLIDKGDAKGGLNAAREEILRRHVTGVGRPVGLRLDAADRRPRPRARPGRVRLHCDPGVTSVQALAAAHRIPSSGAPTWARRMR